MSDTSLDYEYRGMVASVWDLLRGDYSAWPDRPFYRQLIELHGQPALDVGCGTGRLVLDYVSAGIDVDGVDASPDMLALCRQKAAALGIQPRLFEQSMETLDLPRHYGTIFVPSSSFQLLTSEDAAREAMRRLHRHLLSGGVLVMSLMLLVPASPPPHMQWTDWAKAGRQQRPEDGTTVRRQIRTKYDYARQLDHTETRYEVVRDGAVVEEEMHARSPATRWYTQEQTRQFYLDAGFAGVRLTSGFTEAPASPDDRVFCVLGTRP
jgi:ubiquinone/menaquinone biosynthesis C-methylase UbiE